MVYYFKIGEVCSLYGITPDTLRHYEAKGLLSPRRDAVSGYRMYSVMELDVIEFILTAKTLGIPLAEIRRVIESEDVDAYRAMYEKQERLLTEKIAALQKLRAVTSEKRATLATLVAPERLQSEAQTVYLVDVETLFATPADPQEMEGMAQVSTWRLFQREAGEVQENETLVGLSFAASASLTPLEQGFRALVAQGLAERRTLAAESWRRSFWGDDAALLAALTAEKGEAFFVRTRYSLLHKDGQHEHFVDIFADDEGLLKN